MPQVAQRARVAVAQDRRDMSPRGAARRARFDASLDLLRALGLADEMVEHYRRLARKTRKLPHELVRTVVEEAAEHAGVIARVGLDSGRPS